VQFPTQRQVYGVTLLPYNLARWQRHLPLKELLLSPHVPFSAWVCVSCFDFTGYSLVVIVVFALLLLLFLL